MVSKMQDFFASNQHLKKNPPDVTHFDDMTTTLDGRFVLATTITYHGNTDVTQPPTHLLFVYDTLESKMEQYDLSRFLDPGFSSFHLFMLSNDLLAILHLQGELHICIAQQNSEG